MTTWGSNLVVFTEATDHTLVVATWWAALRDRWRWTVGLTAALGATHPWSGLQHLLALNGFFVLTALPGGASGRTRLARRWGCVVGALAALAVFCWNSGVFLPSFESHRQTQEEWRFAWVLPWKQMRLWLLPVALLAGSRLVVDLLGRWRRPERPWSWGPWKGLLATTGLVSLVSAKHELFVSAPVQPFHFDRGNIETSLSLIGLPLLARGFDILAWNRFACLSTLVVGICALDQAFWIANATQFGHQIRLSQDERAVLSHLADQNASGPALFEFERLGCLAPAYALLRPYMGHWANTPGGLVRRQRLQEPTRRGDHLELLDQADWLILSASTHDRLAEPIRQAGFQERLRLDTLVVSERPSAAPVIDSPPGHRP